MKNYTATYYSRTNGGHFESITIEARNDDEAYRKATQRPDDWGCAGHRTFVELYENEEA